jgi:hypothetical protein
MGKDKTLKIKTTEVGKDGVLRIKANVVHLTDTYDKLFAMCLRQLKPATNLNRQDVAQRLIERNQLITALESYLAAKGEKDAP